MLAINSYSRRYRVPCTTMTLTSTGPGALLSRPRLPPRSYARPKSAINLQSFDATPFSRSKRLKSRKINACQKMDAIKKSRTPDYTETAYREAVSKLKYLLAESYAPRLSTGRKISRERVIYRRSNPRINETPEDSDERSVSDCSRAVTSKAYRFEDNLNVAASHNSVFPARQLPSSPSELTSFIARQEEYIEQLEQESRYCKDELKNLLEKIREVVAENAALHDKNKSGLLKSFLKEYESCDDKENIDKPNLSSADTLTSVDSSSKKKLHRALEGPSIVFESRISELEAQLTQAKIELKKARQDTETKRLSENAGQSRPDLALELEQALRDKRELNEKLDEALKNLKSARDREVDETQKSKRASELVHQTDYEKYQAQTEIRRLNDELDRQREKVREISQETNRRVAEERHQIERRWSQQVEQLSADVASHWDAASRSHMETEKQRRELADLKRDLVQKQSMIDDLKKDLHNKISNLQSDLNQALTEKDAAEQEVASTKLMAERSERHARHEQSRWQVEINSYKQRLERADADILHCRRENLRLSEQIASLEKELNMSKLTNAPEPQTPAITPRPEGEKDLTTMIMDMETKHAATAGGLEDALSNQAKLVSRLTAECQSLTQRLEANDRTHKEEMASLQSNLEYLTSKINDTLDNKKAGNEPLASDRQKAQHNDDESTVAKSQIGNPSNYAISSAVEGQPYTRDYDVNQSNRFQEQNDEYANQQADRAPVDSQPELNDNRQQDYVAPVSQKYEGEEYRMNDQNYPADYANQEYPQYEEYNQSQYEQNPTDEVHQSPGSEGVVYQQDQQHYQDYPAENYPDNSNQPVAIDEQEYERPTITGRSNLPET